MTPRNMLVTGVANPKSLAWSCALALRAAGHRVLAMVQTERMQQRMRAASAATDIQLLGPLEATQADPWAPLLPALHDWCGGQLHGALHALAYAPATALQGRVQDVTAADFAEAMQVSCHSLLQLTRACAPLLVEHGAVVTLSYYGAHKVDPHYGVMGVCKAALEAAVRYLALELGPRNIGVFAVSPGPFRTRAAIGVPGFVDLLEAAATQTPLRRLATREELGAMVAFLCSGQATASTGSTFYVDAGRHSVL